MNFQACSYVKTLQTKKMQVHKLLFFHLPFTQSVLCFLDQGIRTAALKNKGPQEVSSKIRFWKKGLLVFLECVIAFPSQIEFWDPLNLYIIYIYIITENYKMNTVPMKSKRCPPTLWQLPRGYPLKPNPINRALKVVQKIRFGNFYSILQGTNISHGLKKKTPLPNCQWDGICWFPGG